MSGQSRAGVGVPLRRLPLQLAIGPDDRRTELCLTTNEMWLEESSPRWLGGF